MFPRVVDADNDSRKDLLIGEAEGTIRLYRNINTDDDPQFDAGTLLRVGLTGLKTDIDVGQRTTPTAIDWNNDGVRDMLVGYGDGLIRLYRGISDLADASTPPATADRLLPAYPNPFNPTVTIPFVLSGPGRVVLSVYNATGRLIALLVDDVLPEGRHEVNWSGVDMRGRPLPSGIYFILLNVEDIKSTGKVTLVR